MEAKRELVVCPNCDALKSIDQVVCPVCGVSSTQIPINIQEDETQSFLRAILTRPANFTILLLFANVAVFILMSASGGSTNAEVLRAYGAKYNSLIVEEGQWWRFITPIFIHIGAIHLLSNMYGLWILGQYVERLYGSKKFVFFWVATGIAGVVASFFTSMPELQNNVTGPLKGFLFRGDDGPSAGASGALFGLIGILLVFGIKYRNELPDGFKRAFGTGMLPTIIINLIIGYVVPFIDNSAHMGGLAAGIVFALFVGYKRPGRTPGLSSSIWRFVQVSCLVLVVLSFGIVAKLYDGPSVDLKNLSVGALPVGPQSALPEFLNRLNQGQDAFVTAYNSGDTSKIGPALSALSNTTAPDQDADRLKDDLRALLKKTEVVIKEGRNLQRIERLRERKRLGESFKQWNERLHNWVKTSGPQYGITFQEEPKE